MTQNPADSSPEADMPAEASPTSPQQDEGTQDTATHPSPEDTTEVSPEADEPDETLAEAEAKDPAANPKPELLKLIDLAAKYPEIGPPLAELAFKIGQPEFAHRIVRMGLDKDGPGLEYYFVVAHSARRERRFEEARGRSVEAIRAFLRTPDEELASDDGERLLHLVRLGYSTLLFDEKDPKGDPGFVSQLKEVLPALGPRLDSEAFFHALLAQTHWYEDLEASEKAWERAVELDASESTWNARGTWYKDAEKDLDKAEAAYRRGLEKAPTSPLLLHNLGQLLVDKAERPEVDVERARRLLNDAEQVLRAALREESPKGLRRHVHATRDRLAALRSSLPPRTGPRQEEPEPEREPEPGEVIQGRVRSLAAFGAFVSLPGCGTGLLHKSEISHEPVDDPAKVLEVGQTIDVKVMEVSRKEGKLRIALSRRALLPKPEGAQPHRSPSRPQPQANRPREDRGRGRSEDRRGQDRNAGRRSRDNDKLASLGEMLLAKINQQKKDG